MAIRYRDLPIGVGMRLSSLERARSTTAPAPEPRPISLSGGNGQPAPYTEPCEPCGKRTLGVLWCMACGQVRPDKPGVTTWP